MRGEPVLIMLDELPPYFQAAQAVRSARRRSTRSPPRALANLLDAVSSGKLPNVCVVLTDLSGSAYAIGSERISAALARPRERGQPHRSSASTRSASTPTSSTTSCGRASSAKLPARRSIEAVADAYAAAARRRPQDRPDDRLARDAARRDRQRPTRSIPAIRDLYARFRENPGFQQTRALIRLMRIIVAGLWTLRRGATRSHLIGGPRPRPPRRRTSQRDPADQPTFDNAIAHDIAERGPDRRRRADRRPGTATRRPGRRRADLHVVALEGGQPDSSA